MNASLMLKTVEEQRILQDLGAMAVLSPCADCEVYLDGIPLKGEWRGGTRRPNRRGEEVKAMKCVVCGKLMKFVENQ